MAGKLEGRNRASADEAASFIDKFEELEKQVDSLRGEFMAKVKKVREAQSELLDDAKSQGVAKKVVKTVVEARRLEAKAKEKMEDLEDDDRVMAVDIRKALGDYADLPLGAAAVDREDRTTSAIVGAVRKSMTDDEWDKAAPAAATH